VAGDLPLGTPKSTALTPGRGASAGGINWQKGFATAKLSRFVI